MFPVSYYVPSSTIPTIPELKYVWSTSLAPYYVRDLEINIQNQVLHLMKRNAVHDENQRLPTLTPPPTPSVNLFFFTPFTLTKTALLVIAVGGHKSAAVTLNVKLPSNFC